MRLKFYALKELLIFNIKYYRYLNKYSQETLAEKCNLSSRYITDIERGLHCPTIDKIELIAKAFNLEPFELFQNNDRDKDVVNKMNKTRQYNQQ